MTDAYDMIDVAQSKLQKLVGEYSAGVSKAKQAMICEDSSQTHSPGMEDCLMAQTAETSMAVYNLDAFAYHNVSKYWEEGEDSGKGSLAVDDEEGYVVHLEAVRQIAHTCPAGVCVCDNYDFVTTIDEFLEQVSSAGICSLRIHTVDS